MITKGLLSQVYNILSQAKLEKCSIEERIDVIKALRAVRQEVENIQGFINEVREKNADIIGVDAAKVAEINRVVNAELEKPSETNGTKILKQETLMHVIDGNPTWNAAIIMAIEDVFLSE